MVKEIFEAYDIRGIYPDEINADIASDIVGYIVRDFIKSGKVVVGRDIRVGSWKMYKAVVRSFKRSGIKVEKAGIITTPMLYFLVNNINASGGVMVTASHNPKEYNGLKVVGKNAIPISGKDIYEKIKEHV